MLDFNSRSALPDRINHLIDTSFCEEEGGRGYLGASVVGHQCERHVQYHLLAARGEVARKDFPPRIRRIFDRGHLYEDRMKDWLKQSGFVFQKGSDQKGFSDFGGQFSGHVDGILIGWRQACVCPITLPVLWENKCLGSKGWKKLSVDKLKDYSPTYYAQVQLYMYYLKPPRCLFTAINADTMEIYHELVEYDPTEAALYRSRVQQIIAASDEGRLVARCSSDRNFYVCKFCDFREICWTMP